MPEYTIPEYRISTDRLQVGVFIRLEGLKWHEHPFLFKNFKISGNDQIETLREMGIKEVICVPGKSDVLPLSEATKTAEREDTSAGKAAVEALWGIKKERAERLKQQHEVIAQREKSYVASQERIGKIMTGIAAADLNSVKDAADFAETFSKNFMEDAESTLHLMRLDAKDENIYYHSMNVAVLSMLVGKVAGINEEEMKILCQGALFHDVGKSRIDRKLLAKEGSLNKIEMDLLKMHPKYGVESLAYSETFPKLALIILYQHHECCDGSGYPKGLKGPQIHLLTKLVSIADVYDNHCNKRNPVDSLTPYEALSYMFSRQKAAFDEKLLSTFIHCLGIYPSGTVVQFNNGSIGIVIAVNPKNQLQPSVVLYDPEVPQKDALIIDMRDEPDLKITQSIRPAALPQEIFDYLSPRTRITYYVDPTTEASKGDGAPS